MTSRERVQSALNFEETDRVPADLGGMKSSGISVYAYDKLKQHLGMESGTIRIQDLCQMLAFVEGPVLDRLGLDVVPLEPAGHLWKSYDFVGQWEPWEPQPHRVFEIGKGNQVIPTEDGGWDLLDNAGARSLTMPEGGFYFDKVSYPSEDDIPRMETWNPDCSIPDEELDYLQKGAEYLYNYTDRAIIGSGFHLGLTNLGNYIGGFTGWLCLLLTEPNYCHDIMAKTVEAAIRRMELINQAVGKYCVAWVVANDDMGSQRAEFVRPELWEETVKPHYKRFCDAFHGFSSMKTFLHCCGSVYHLIPHLVDCGFDILNPVQTSAENMDPVRLKEEFGGKIVFWGGGCDTQQVLPFASPEEIREHVRERLEILSPGGGFIFTPVHNIQAGTPPENIVAMYEAAAGGAR